MRWASSQRKNRVLEWPPVIGNEANSTCYRTNMRSFASGLPPNARRRLQSMTRMKYRVATTARMLRVQMGAIGAPTEHMFPAKAPARLRQTGVMWLAIRTLIGVQTAPMSAEPAPSDQTENTTENNEATCGQRTVSVVWTP